MKSIIAYIGMDVHKESFSLCTYFKDEDKVLFKEKIASDLHELLQYFEVWFSYIRDECAISEIFKLYFGECGF